MEQSDLRTRVRSGLRVPDWIWLPLGIYVASRVASTVILWWSARSQVALTLDTPVKVTRPLPASPSVLEVATNWDGQWYWDIVLHGYPGSLPAPDALIQQSPFGFFPGYPTVVDAVVSLTGLGFPAAAVAVSTLAGAGAVVVIHRLLLRSVSPFVAGANVALLCAWPSAAVLQVAYTESMALLLVGLALLAVASRRYLLVAVLAVGLGLVRPLTVPLALVVLAHATARWRDGADEVPRRDRVGILVALVGCGIGAIAWPSIAGLQTGDPLTYFRAIGAWGSADDRAGGWFGTIVREADPLLLLVVALTVGGILWSLRPRPNGRTWPLEARAWSIGYLFYVLLTTVPAIGVARYLLLLVVPFWPMVDDTRPETGPDRLARRIALGTLLVLALAGQWWWVSNVFTFDGPPNLQNFP